MEAAWGDDEGHEALGEDGGPTDWCPLPLSYRKYVLSMGVGTTEPRKYSVFAHGGKVLTRQGHAYSVTTCALTKRICICPRAQIAAAKHPFTGEAATPGQCKCGPLLSFTGA